MRIATLLLALLSAPLASAQDVLEFREARFVDPLGRVDTTGLGLGQIMTGPDSAQVWVGQTLLEIRRGEMEVVGFSFDPYTNAPIVSLELAPEAAETFARFTRENVGWPLAIVLGDRLLSAPRINGAITGGRISIDGVTEDEAFELIASIRTAVGGRSPRERVREQFDLSTPEAAAESMEAALRHRDWQYVVKALHPRFIGPPDESTEGAPIQLSEGRATGTAEPLNGVSVLVEPILGVLPSGTTLDDLSHEDTWALALALAAEVRREVWFPVTAGEIVDVSVVGAKAYVVRDETWPGDDGGLASASVLVFERMDESGEWRMLMPAP